MKKYLFIAFLALLLVAQPTSAALIDNIRGQILLQVEMNGEAWYVNPTNDLRYFMGRPADAFELMRELGLGIKHTELTSYLNTQFPERLSGKIMIDVEQNGEAYYVYPVDLQGHYLGRPADAFEIMRNKGLGITNENLITVPLKNQYVKYTYPNSFEIEYPSHWEVETDSSYEELVELLDMPNADTEGMVVVDNLQEILLAVTKTSNPTPISISTIADNIASNYNSNEYFSGKYRQVNNLSVFQQVFGESSRRGEQITFVHLQTNSNTIFTFVLAEDYDDPNHEEDFENFIKSIITHSITDTLLPHIRGDADAPVKLIEYCDFEGPFCLRHQDTLDQILTNFDGQVSLEYRHFPLSFHPNAQKAAEASECAGEQGKFWEMHDALWLMNKNETMSISQFKQSANDLNLNEQQFNNCLDNGMYADKVKSQFNQGQIDGVTGTPGTFVNGQIIAGAIPYANFESVILQELSK